MHLPDGEVTLVGTKEELATYKRELFRVIKESEDDD